MEKNKNKKEKKIGLFKKFFYLLKSSREYKKYAWGSVIFVFFETVFECILPYVMMLLINKMGELQGKELTDAVKADAINQVLIYGGILIAIAICSLICGVSAGKMSAVASAGFSKNLRYDEFKKITTFSFNNIDKFSTSSLITRQTTDVTNIQMAYMMLIRIAIRAPFMFIFSIVMAITVFPEMWWIFLITVPFIAIILFTCIPIASRMFNKLFKKYDDLNELTEENVRGMRVVKTYAREEQQKEKFFNESKEMGKGFEKVEMVLSLTNPAMQNVMYLSMALILTFGSMFIMNTGKVDHIGALSSLITYSAQTLSSLMMVAMILFMVVMSVPAIHRVYEVLTETPSIQNNEGKNLKDVKNGNIDFNNVSFKYKENAKKYALSNINLHIKEGETIGIIGGTGSSKSTLVNLISRFYDASVGEVKVGDINVKDYDVKALRNNVAMVLQKNILFGGSIIDNMKWGKEDATLEEIKEACKIACADEFIEQLPNKYEYQIAQGGVNVSGGQRQRLCIARALLKNPKVIILDDSTSAVDTKTDAIIRKGFKEYIPGVTKIIIAQRVASVEDADRIIVLDNGEINGIGTHEELLKTNKIYQEVYEIQNKIGGNGNEKE